MRFGVVWIFQVSEEALSGADADVVVVEFWKRWSTNSVT